MKKRLLPFVVLLFFVIEMTAGVLAVQGAVPATNLFTGLIISWQQQENSPDTLWIRTKEQKTGAWTKWYQIEADADSDEFEGPAAEKLKMENQESGQATKNKLAFTSRETLFSTNVSTDFEYKIIEAQSKFQDEMGGIQNIYVEPIFSDRPAWTTLLTSLNIPTKSTIVSRSTWGANEEITFVQSPSAEVPGNGENLTDNNEQSALEEQDPEIARVVAEDAEGRAYVWPLQYAKEIKFIVIHHTASVTNLDNPKTAIQNIQYYHAVKRGWGDIGYNYVIDTEGNIYEGRKGGERVIGGHTKPLNKVSIGIAVLGNYEENELPSKVVRSLTGLVGEKAKRYSIPIAGATVYNEKTYNNVQGHSENTATACPGRFLKQKFFGIRDMIAYQANPDPRDIERRDIMVTPADTEKEFSVRLKNTGAQNWNSDTFLELVETNDTAVLDLPKVMARLDAEKVPPGMIGTFKGKLPRLLHSGLHVPQFKIVINGSVRTDSAIPLAFFIDGVKADYEVVERQDPPKTLRASQRATAWIKLKNTGNITWQRGGKNAVRLGAIHPTDRQSSFFRNSTHMARMKEKEVAPGEVGTFIFHLKAPKLGGSYTEYFAPVIEGVTWILDRDLHFDVFVASKEKPLRVALSFFEPEAHIKSATGMKLQAGTVTKEFSENVTVTVKQKTSESYEITAEDSPAFVVNFPPRFRAINSGGIVQLANFENRPPWNQKLNDNLFRGVLEVRTVDGQLQVINELPLEDYLRGIAEISNGDPPEKIKTIIILARSYALYYRDIGQKFPGKPYHLDDDPNHTQKYIGYGLEPRSPNIVAAVEATRGKAVTYEGKVVITPYFNQSDGRTRSAKEMWGWEHTPYLQSVPDPFCGTVELKGHGVGVSGCGATELAKLGKTAEEIIQYYYKGVLIESPG